MHQVKVARTETGSKLTGIEALRGIAASLVVASHAARHLDRAVPAPELLTLFQPGHAGVDLFFTLSGFIIFFVHRRDIGQPSRLGHYASRRFDRVMPLYWAALAITVGLSVLGGRPTPSVSWLAWWAALLPTAHEPLFGIAWTLQYEAMFYVCFGVLIARKRAGVALLVAWLLAILAGIATVLPNLPLCSAFGLEFLFGMASAYALQRLSLTRPLRLAGLGAAFFAAAYAFEAAGVLDGFGVLARFAYGLPSALLIAGLAAAERAGSLTVPRPLATIGSASYSIYLFQFVFIGCAWQALLATGLADRLPAVALFPLLVGAALAGGVAASRTVERPLQAALRRRGWTGLLSWPVKQVPQAPPA